MSHQYNEHPPYSYTQPPPPPYLNAPTSPPGSHAHVIQHTPKRGGRKGLWIILGVVGAALVLCVGGATILGAAVNDVANDPGTSGIGSTTDAGTSAAPLTPQKSEADPVTKVALGKTVRGGDFNYTISDWDCGIKVVGDDFLTTKPQGQYCRAVTTARNVTKDPHHFMPDGTMTVSDAQGRSYSVDSTAVIYGNESGGAWLNEINPGNQVKINVYFDVPKDVKPTVLTFDAGLFTFAEDVEVVLG